MTAHRLVAGTALLGLTLSPGCVGDTGDPSATPGRPDTLSATPATATATTTAPRLKLRISGNLEGYLMPCGCASGQLGGLARRGFRNKVDQHNIDLLLEGGNLVKAAGELNLEKLLTILEILDDQGYTALGIGPKDLGFDHQVLGSFLVCYPKLAALASDLTLADGKPWLVDAGDHASARATPGTKRTPVTHPFREHKLDHVTVRLASLVMQLPATTQKTFKLIPPSTAWQAAMRGVAATTYRILMVHADRDKIEQLAPALDPKPDLIIAVSRDYVEPPSSKDEVSGVPLVYTGEHGRILLDVTLTRGPDGPVLTRYQLVPLKGSRTAPNAMRDKVAVSMILGHRRDVKETNLLERLAETKPLPEGLRYVGAATCTDCHETAAEDCGAHAHGHAWQTLIDAEKREDWPVTHYPECVSCHVVGYGYKSGFVSPKKTPELRNVTCESCHGPGSAHAEDDTVKMQEVTVKTCTACHNFEHSPKFDYTSYWKKIKHGHEK